MLGFLEPLKKFCRGEKVAIDNPVFRLHYKVTVILFILGSVLLNGKQYFGEPIECTTRSEVPPKIVSTYCWITGTYTIPGDPTMFRSVAICIVGVTMRVSVWEWIRRRLPLTIFISYAYFPLSSFPI